MSPLTAIARATAMMALGATSLVAQVDRQIYRSPTSKPIITTPAPGPTLERPLPAPANLTVTPARTEATLRWDPVPGATGYLVTRTSRLYGTIQQTSNPIGSTSFTDVSQQFDPRYLHTYNVSAIYPDGRASTSSVTYLPAPASVSYPQHYGNRYVGATGWTTTWAAVSEATGYIVRYKMQLTNGLNLFWTVDTTFAVAAPTTSHSVGEWNGSAGLGNAPSAIYSAAVSATFANGARSAATASP
jgi:hypothetical protein